MLGYRKSKLRWALVRGWGSLCRRSVDTVTLGQFVAALELDVFDSVFVAMFPALELQVIVFEDDNAGRVYEWLSYPRLT